MKSMGDNSSLSKTSVVSSVSFMSKSIRETPQLKLMVRREPLPISLSKMLIFIRNFAKWFQFCPHFLKPIFEDIV